MTSPAPHFDDAFRQTLEQLLVWRRDVRHFMSDPVPHETVERLLDLAQLSPSVGNSQPWRWIDVRSIKARAQVRENFLRCNSEALAMQPADRRGLYARLKLAGLEAAPLHFAVCCEIDTVQGHGLGRLTMPEMLEYSAVSSIFTFWLAARSVGLGVGWVSILDRAEIEAALDLPSTYRLVAYLCVGWPQADHAEPELERLGWQERTSAGRHVLIR